MSPITPDSFVYSTTPITSTTPGEVIQNLDLYVTGDQPAIDVTSDNVTIKNVRIHTTTGDGIQIWANNASISNVEVDGPAPGNDGGHDGRVNYGIYAYNVTGLQVDHATFHDMGTGVAAVQSPGTIVSEIEGYDMQGPFPGGQLVQFGRSAGSSLTDFYVYNDAAISHPEDDISVIDSPNSKVSQGVVDGDNSPSGVAVMAEGASDGTKVNNVDAIHMGDGAFSSYSNDVFFDHVRSFDNSTADQGRGKPMSNGLIFNAAGSGVSFTNATYTRPGDPNNIVSGQPATAQISQDQGAIPMAHITNSFPWAATLSSTVPTAVAPTTPAATMSATTTTSEASGQGTGFVIASSLLAPIASVSTDTTSASVPIRSLTHHHWGPLSHNHHG